MINPNTSGVRIRLVFVLLSSGLAVPMIAAQSVQLAANYNVDLLDSLHRVDSAGSLGGGTEPLSNCGDALSIALQQGTPEFPCWANIRTVDRWNSASFGFATSPRGDGTKIAPQNVPSSFTFAAGGVSAFSLPGDGQGKAYGGLGAMSGLIEHRRWQLMAEDAGGLADLQLHGGHLVGLNLSAVRMTGEIAPRLTWQGSATNTYGTDAMRQVAPIDYRMVGEAETPAPDAPVYGMHDGRMTEGEESAKLRYENTRQSAWDFASSHNYTKYDADGFLVNTARARVEYLHRIPQGTALGVFASGEHQTQPLECTLSGAGMRLLTSYSSRASLNLSAEVNGANRNCGTRLQLTGNGALYLRLSSHTDFDVTGKRDLSDGIISRTFLLSTGGTGVRHEFGHGFDMAATLNELYGVDPRSKQTYHGSFVNGALHCRQGTAFSEQLELRRFSVSASSAEIGRTVAVFTLWWSPPRGGDARRAVSR